MWHGRQGHMWPCPKPHMCGFAGRRMRRPKQNEHRPDKPAIEE